MLDLTASEYRHLLLTLSDRESGSARQWLLLELAAGLPVAALSRRVWLLRFMPTPALSLFSLPVVRQLYAAPRASIRTACLRGCDDAFLLLTAAIALLAGFGRLPASQQFVVWLLLIGGVFFKLWRRLREPLPPVPEITGEEAVPGAEAALGLRGLLLARGLAPAEVAVLLAGWQTQPQAALPRLLAALPQLRPPAPLRRDLILFELTAWTAVMWPATWLLGWLWGWLGVIVLACGLSWAIHHRLRQPGLIALTGLLMFALAKLLHWI